MKALKNKKGLTLVELLLSISLFAVICAVLSVIVYQGFLMYHTEMQNNMDESNIRSAMEEIVSDMHKTTKDNITLPNNSTLSVNGKVYSFDGNGHILKDGNIWISGISAFSVSSGSGVVSLSVTSTGGKTIATSFGLR